MRKFRAVFLDEVFVFFDSIEEDVRDKIVYNIDKAKQTNDPRIFKKLTKDIWEFRVHYGNLQYRLFAFWDKRDNTDTLVVCTHGIVKKTDKVPQREIDKAENLRVHYFENQ